MMRHAPYYQPCEADGQPEKPASTYPGAGYFTQPCLLSAGSLCNPPPAVYNRSALATAEFRPGKISHALHRFGSRQEHRLRARGSGDRPMSEERRFIKDALSPSLAPRLVSIRSRFERAWQSASSPTERPRIEEYLGMLAAQERLLLLTELILLEVHCRRLRGEDPKAAHYSNRFPELDPAWLAGA